MPCASADPHVHSQNIMYRHTLSAQDHDVVTNAESRLRPPPSVVKQCASQKHESKQPHGHACMRPDVTLVPALLDLRTRQHARTQTRVITQTRTRARGCWSQIARMQVYATHQEYATALKISRFAKHYGSDWGCRVLPRVRSTTTPRRVALAASRSQFGRVRVRLRQPCSTRCCAVARLGVYRIGRRPARACEDAWRRGPH